MNSLVSLTNISFTFDQEAVLKNVGLTIKKGDYVGVIGPNGGGKTTLLKIMLGLLTPQKGEVKLFGQPMAKFKDWPRIGYVPQFVGGQGTRLPMTVEEVVRMGRTSRRSLWAWFDRTDQAAITEAMEKTGVVALGKHLLSELSGGQRQRVFIAKALAAKPELLILDEPTTGIDLASQEAFYELLANLNKNEGLTLVMVSHDIDVVVNEATQVACINQTLIYHGDTKAFSKGDYLSKLYGQTRKFVLHGH